jgi:hypothetical protein
MKGLQQLLSVVAISLAGSVALSACRKDEQVTASGSAPGNADLAALAAKPATEVPTGPSGVPECDETVAQAEHCVQDKVPEDERAALRNIIEQARYQYKLDTLKPETKAALPERCKKDFEKTKNRFGHYGCTWKDLPASAPAPSAAAASAEPAASAPSAEPAPEATADAGSKKKHPAAALKKPAHK